MRTPPYGSPQSTLFILDLTVQQSGRIPGHVQTCSLCSAGGCIQLKCLLVVLCAQLHYRPQRSWGKVMFLEACVILFTGGVSASVHAGIPHPPEQTPPEADTPLEAGHPPRADTPQSTPPGADTPQKQIPLEADTPWSRHPREQTPSLEQTPPSEQTHTLPRADPPEQTPPPWWKQTHTPRSRPPPEQTPRADTPPPPPPGRACWEIRSTRGRYASYWNAILFKVCLCVHRLRFDLGHAPWRVNN